MILTRLWLFFAVVVGVAAVETAALFAITLGNDDPASTVVQFSVAAGVALVGSGMVVSRTRFLRRPWNTASDDAVVAGFVARWVVQVTLAFGAMNLGFAGAILTGAWWIGLLGLVFFLAPLPRLVPTERNLHRVEAELAEQGAAVDLVVALRRPVGASRGEGG